MPAVEWARTDLVVVHSFFHDAWEAPMASEWWACSCVAFTTFGSWEVRSRHGRGVVGPDTLLVGQGGTEYDCRHEGRMDDRALSVTYRNDVDIDGSSLLLRLNPRFHMLRRSLVAELRVPEPEIESVDQICDALLETIRQEPGRARQPKTATRALVARLRAEADKRYADPTLDLVAEAAALGMSRTRLIHAFRELVGVTPHRYVIELRTARAGWLLTRTRASVTDICFESGCGSLARFHVAFHNAYGTTPSAYRASHYSDRRRTFREASDEAAR